MSNNEQGIRFQNEENAPESHERRIIIFRGYYRADSIATSLSVDPATRTGHNQYAESGTFHAIIMPQEFLLRNAHCQEKTRSNGGFLVANS